MTTGQIHTIGTLLIAFGLFLWVVKKFAAGPILGLLDERGATIERAFNDIDSQKAELAKLKAEYDARLARIEQEAQDRRDAAIKEGERVAAELRTEAQTKYAELLEKGREDLAIEVAKARILLRDQFAELATQAAERVVREQLNDTRQRSLIDRYIEDLTRVN